MGKKSKKGVVRTNTKKHNAAGHGKSASAGNSKTLGSGRYSGGNSQISSCENSLDSNSVVFNSQMKPATATNTMGVTPMPIVHVKEQLPPIAPSQRRLTEEDIRNMIISNIIQQRNMNDKENKSGMPPITVLSSKQPAVFTLNLDDGNIDNVTELQMPLAKEQQPEQPLVETANETATTNDSTPVEEQTTVVTENVTELVVPTPATEGTVLSASESIVNDVPEIPQVVTEPPSETPSTANAAQGVAVETVPSEMETVPAKEESVVEATLQLEVVPPTELDAVPVKDFSVVESTEPVAPTESEVKQSNDSQQQQIWSSTLRSIVSTDEDEVLADTPISNKAVMDVTPLKHSKLVVPLIQTVSPSPEHVNKQRNITYLNYEEPIPSLDTPDKKDLDQNLKQNLCGCTIM